jgi:ribosome-interacting GTPase 1
VKPSRLSRVHLVAILTGFPSVGKSTLLTWLTGTLSEAASYEFTTVRPPPLLSLCRL